MTRMQRESIAALRKENYSYRFIGDVMGINPETVKATCRRKGYAAEGPRKTKQEKASAVLCEYCQKPLRKGMRRGARFCSNKCRVYWRRKHLKVTKIALDNSGITSE